jgi:hypothetical protein
MKPVNSFWMQPGAAIAGALYITVLLKVGEPYGDASAEAIQLTLAFSVLLLAVAAVASLYEWRSKISIPCSLLGLG